jgi:hypothetical protein
LAVRLEERNLISALGDDQISFEVCVSATDIGARSAEVTRPVHDARKRRQDRREYENHKPDRVQVIPLSAE